MRARPAFLASVAALAAACGRGEADVRGPDASSTATEATTAAGPEVAPARRRPTRRYWMARSGDRCEVGFTDGARSSTPIEAPCPSQLASGERIRLAGKACVRESAADPAREVPVLCPDHVLMLERSERAHADAGAR